MRYPLYRAGTKHRSNQAPIDVVAYCFNISETISQQYAIEVIGASVYEENK